MNDYTVYKHYHYCEIYHVEALNEKAAIEIVDDVEFDQDPDDIFQEFDFQTIELMEEK